MHLPTYARQPAECCQTLRAAAPGGETRDRPGEFNGTGAPCPTTEPKSSALGGFSMKRRTFLTSAATVGLAMPSIAGAAAANTLRFVPQAGLSNLDPIWTTIDVVRNASLLFWDTLYG